MFFGNLKKKQKIRILEHCLTVLTAVKTAVNVTWQETASPPRTDRSVVFASWRQCAPPSDTRFLGRTPVRESAAINDISTDATYRPTCTETTQRATRTNHTDFDLKCIDLLCKGSACERRVPELIPVHGCQHAGDVSHKPGGRLPSLSTRHAVTLATLKRAGTDFAAWWTQARWVWTVCLRLLPDSVAAAIWTQALLRLSLAR